MFAKNVYSFKNLPVEEKQRKWTDCCCTIVGAIYALTLFIIACAAFNRQHFLQANYPVESTGKQCYLDLNTTPFIYFRYVQDFTKQRYCLSICPKNGEQIQCSATTNCSGVISTYDTKEVVNQLGGYCGPTDSSIQKTFWSNSAVTTKLNNIQSFNITLVSLAIAVCTGLLYLIIFVIVPKNAKKYVFILCSLTILAAGIVLLVQPIKLLAFDNNSWNILLGIIFIILAIIFAVFLFCHQKQIELASIFLEHSNEFLKENWVLFFYIPLFGLFSFGLVVLVVWQYVSFSSINSPTWNSADVYMSIQQQMFLQVLNFIEFVWGIQFIRDSFNYIISGNSVEWYFNHNNNIPSQCSRPVNRLLSKNFGSIVAGAFLNAFLNLFGIFFDIVRCDSKGSFGKSQKNCRSICCCCTAFIDLARADAYAYINLTGIPYCNAARQCQAVCQQTHLFSNNQTCIRLYRIAAQFFVVTLSVLLTFIIFRAKTSFVNMFVLAIVVCTCYLMSTHFVDIHSNAAQGLVTCYLVQVNCQGDQIAVCPRGLRNDIYNYEQEHQLIQ